jgi:transcription antitermination protein NusB
MSESGVLGARRRAREMALQLLFQAEFAVGGLTVDSARDMLKRFQKDFEIEDEVADYGGTLFIGIVEKMTDIDGVIQSSSSHWKVSRMGLVDRSVMRVAVFEMKFMQPALNPRIAINEAVEIAKIFGSTESSSFVNGVLDPISRRL